MRTAIRRGGQFCYSSVANLLKYLFAKNYENMRFDKVFEKITKINCNFFLPHSIEAMKKIKWFLFLFTVNNYLLSVVSPSVIHSHC